MARFLGAAVSAGPDAAVSEGRPDAAVPEVDAAADATADATVDVPVVRVLFIGNVAPTIRSTRASA
ncbi:MAG TPA: hypothetical protein VIL20_29470 [Sandaracinaceae bacterium]